MTWRDATQYLLAVIVGMSWFLSVLSAWVARDFLNSWSYWQLYGALLVTHVLAMMYVVRLWKDHRLVNTIARGAQ